MAKPETLMIDDTKYIRADAAQPTVSYVAGTKWGWEIGKRYFIRTVTMHLHGLIIDIVKARQAREVAVADKMCKTYSP